MRYGNYQQEKYFFLVSLCRGRGITFTTNNFNTFLLPSFPSPAPPFFFGPELFIDLITLFISNFRSGIVLSFHFLFSIILNIIQSSLLIGFLYCHLFHTRHTTHTHTYIHNRINSVLIHNDSITRYDDDNNNKNTSSI